MGVNQDRLKLEVATCLTETDRIKTRALALEVLNTEVIGNVKKMEKELKDEMSRPSDLKVTRGDLAK